MPNPESLPRTPLSSSIEGDAVWSKWTFFITQVGQKPGTIRQRSRYCRGEHRQNWPCQVLLGITTSEDIFNIGIALPRLIKKYGKTRKTWMWWWYWWPRLASSLCLSLSRTFCCYSLLPTCSHSLPSSLSEIFQREALPQASKTNTCIIYINIVVLFHILPSFRKTTNVNNVVLRCPFLRVHPQALPQHS